VPDAMNIPNWSDYEAARRRFFDALAADAAARRLGRAPGGRRLRKPQRGAGPPARAASRQRSPQ
jgi:hypothetical protein